MASCCLIRKFVQRGSQAQRLPPRPDAYGLADSRRDEVWHFFRPEPAAITADSRQTETSPVVEGHCQRVAVEQCHAGRLKHEPHRLAPDAAAVVVAEYRDLGHPDVREQFTGELDFGNLAAFGQIAGDHQQVGRPSIERRSSSQLLRNVRAQVQVANCGKPDRPPRLAMGSKALSDETTQSSNNVLEANERQEQCSEVLHRVYRMRQSATCNVSRASDPLS